MQKSKHAPKNSRESAAQTASEAFAVRPSLPIADQASASASQVGQRRLSGAFFIQLNRIEPDPDQPRKNVDPQHIAELAASIKRLGVLQPISVRLLAESDRYRVIAGECRYQAAKQAGLEEIPCWVRDPDKEQILLQQVIENWQRSDLNPFELADSLAILRDSNGYTQIQLAQTTGKSQGEISKILQLLDLDPEVQSLARSDTSGRISRRHLLAIKPFPVARQLKLLADTSNGRHTAESIELLNAHKKSNAPTDQKHNWQRRAFKTTEATVKITFRKSSINDNDILAALHEVKRQLADDEAS